MKVPTLPQSLIKNDNSIPQILNEISIKEAVSLSISSEPRHERTITIESYLLHITLESLADSLNKLFSQIEQSITSDLNPIQVVDSPKENDPIMQFSIQPDKSKSPSITVTVYIKIENLKQPFVASSLSRLKNHILNALV